MTTRLAATYNVVDIDTHIIEPPDLWTSRMSKKWGDLVPHVRVDPKTNAERWHMGSLKLPTAGAMAHAGWKDFPPGHPPTLAQADLSRLVAIDVATGEQTVLDEDEVADLGAPIISDRSARVASFWS